MTGLQNLLELNLIHVDSNEELELQEFLSLVDSHLGNYKLTEAEIAPLRATSSARSEHSSGSMDQLSLPPSLLASAESYQLELLFLKE